MSTENRPPIHTLENLCVQLHNFQADRPEMKKINEANDAKMLGSLLAGEGTEFKDRLRMNKGVTEIDLLALYELADIIIFSITLLQALGKDPNDLIEEHEPERSQLQMIRKIGDATSKIDMWATDGMGPEVIVQDIKDAAMYSIDLIYSLGLNPMLICFEKVGHNLARYPAERFQEGHQYEPERVKCKHMSREYRLEETFYSPLRPGDENPVYVITT